jgi:Cu(I)/Ag(I) efflux system membrane fusion protein
MKRKLKNNLFEMQKIMIITLPLMILLAACTNKHVEKHDEYTCSMHPDVVKDKPGVCPICGMDLVLRSQYVEDSLSENLETTLQPPNRAVLSSVKTVSPAKMSIPLEVKGQGIVTYDTKNIHDIAARFSGRIEKAYIKSPYQKISKGDRIASIYSPEIVNAQEDLFYLLKNDSDNKVLITSANQKLILLGLTQNQIEKIIQSGRASREVIIYSDYDGYAIAETEKSSNRPDETLSENEMDNRQTKSSVAYMQSAFIREGNYVRSGQVLLRLINAQNIRIEINLPMGEANMLKAGDDVSVSINDQQLQVHISLVQPFTNSNENFLKVRVDALNQNQWRPGQLLTASVMLTQREGYWLPESAVVNTGLNEVVFVKQDKVFVPKKITTSTHSNHFILVNNLGENEIVAADAQFMVDSESFIKTSN